MEWALLAVGLVLGGIAGWLWASSRAAQQGAAAQRDAEGRIRAAESSAQELRTQVTGLQRTSAELQEKIRTESELKAAAEARLKEAHANLEEQEKLLDEALFDLIADHAVAIVRQSRHTDEFLEVVHEHLRR